MTICANPKCAHEVSRAKFVEGIGWLCLDCAPRVRIDAVPGKMFPYTTFSVADKPGGIQVNSLRHLRKLERQYGVQSVAFNMNENSFQDAPRGR
jgi:hypothetical protein